MRNVATLWKLSAALALLAMSYFTWGDWNTTTDRILATVFLLKSEGSLWCRQFHTCSALFLRVLHLF